MKATTSATVYMAILVSKRFSAFVGAEKPVEPPISALCDIAIFRSRRRS